MHWPALLLAVIGHLVFVVGQTAPTSPVASLPSCATTCFNNSQSITSCAATNQTCLCADKRYSAAVQMCVTQTCTIKEQLVTKNTTSTACGVEPRDRSPTLYTTSVTLGVVTAVVVMLRLCFRLFVLKTKLGDDDWAIFATLLIGLPGTMIVCLGTIPNGVGRDVWTLTFDQITNFGMWFYATEIQYLVNLAALKLSLLLFYLRVFPSRTIRTLLWGTVVFDILFGLGFTIAGLVECIPLDYFWRMWDGEHQGHCININALGWANAGISIAMDVWMLALPLSQLRGLRLHWKKKVGVALMFCVGTFVTVVSVLRLHALVTFSNSDNPTFDNFDTHLWSTIEINVGIICACMPAMRQILVWLFPVIFGATTRRDQYYYGSGRRRRQQQQQQHRFNVPRSPGWTAETASTNSDSRMALARTHMGLNSSNITPGGAGRSAVSAKKFRGSVQVSMDDSKVIKVEKSFYIDEGPISPVPINGVTTPSME